MHEFHPDDQYAIITEHFTQACVQGATLVTEPDGSYILQFHVPVPGTTRFMEFTAKLEPFLFATLRTIGYSGGRQVDIEMMLKGVLRRDDHDTVYTTRITD